MRGVSEGAFYPVRCRPVVPGIQFYYFGQHVDRRIVGVVSALKAAQNMRSITAAAMFQREHADRTEVDGWTQSIALPLVQGLTAFWHKDYPTSIRKLHGVRFIANQFGGSHAQRDIIDLTLLEAALRSGQSDLAEALGNERIALKPHNMMDLGFLARAQEARIKSCARAA